MLYRLATRDSLNYMPLNRTPVIVLHLLPRASGTLVVVLRKLCKSDQSLWLLPSWKKLHFWSVTHATAEQTSRHCNFSLPKLWNSPASPDLWHCSWCVFVTCKEVKQSCRQLNPTKTVKCCTVECTAPGHLRLGTYLPGRTHTEWKCKACCQI